MATTKHCATAVIAVGAALLIFIIGVAVGHYKLFPFQPLYEWKNQLEFALSLQRKWTSHVYTATSDRTERPCPHDGFLIVALGQSHAGNHLSSYGDRRSGLATYNFFDGRCYEIEDPVLGATGNKGSLWTDLAHRLAELYPQRPLVFVTAAVGSSAIGDWLDERSGYLGRAESELSRAKQIGLTPALFIWYQGDADAAYNTPGSIYSMLLSKLVGGKKDRAPRILGHPMGSSNSVQ